MLIGLAALVTLTGCIPAREATRVVTTAFAVAGPVDLDVSTSNGRVRVYGVEGASEVQVTATLRSRGSIPAEAADRVAQIEVGMTQDGDHLVLEYDADGHPLDVRMYSGVDFEIVAPAATDADVETSNGWIDVVGVEGILDLRTSNSKIEVTHIVGKLTAATSNGAILLEEIEGVVDAETSNERISFSGRLISGSDHRLVTSNGRIDVAVESDVSLHIEARTSNAEIVTSLLLIGDTTGNAWDAVLNPPATGTLTLATSNGRIEIHGIL